MIICRLWLGTATLLGSSRFRQKRKNSLYSSEEALVTDERQQYQVSPAATGDLSVAVVRSPNEHVPGIVADLSARGMGVIFDREVELALSAGEIVHLQIGSKHLSEPCLVPCVTHRSEEVEGGRLYGFEFVDRTWFLSQFPSAFPTLFNRRHDYRVEPDPRHPIEVTVEGITASFEIKALLRDLSTEGLSFRASPLIPAALAKTKQIGVSFRLPDNPEPLRFLARIRHWDLIGDSICYGVLFDAEGTECFHLKQEALQTYITERRQEALNLLKTKNLPAR